MSKNTNFIVNGKSLVGYVSIIMILFVTQFSIEKAFSQTEDNINSTMTTEELGNQTFSQILISSSQLEEMSKTVNEAEQAIEKGNTTNVGLQLALLENQIEVIRQEANIFK